MNLADATKTSMDGAMWPLSPELELYQNIFSVKEEQRTALKGFLSGKHVFVLYPAGFGKSLVKDGDALPAVKSLIGLALSVTDR